MIINNYEGKLTLVQKSIHLFMALRLRRDRWGMDSPLESFWTWTKTDSFIHNCWIFLDDLWCLSKSWCFAKQKKKKNFIAIYFPTKVFWMMRMVFLHLLDPSSFTISKKIILFSEKISSRHRWTDGVLKTVESETFFFHHIAPLIFREEPEEITVILGIRDPSEHFPLMWTCGDEIIASRRCIQIGICNELESREDSSQGDRPGINLFLLGLLSLGVLLFLH